MEEVSVLVRQQQQVAFHIQYTPDEGGYCAWEPITGTASWGKDLAEAKAMITEALQLYFEVVAEEEDLPLTTSISEEDARILWVFGGYGSHDDFPGREAALRVVLRQQTAPTAPGDVELVVTV